MYSGILSHLGIVRLCYPSAEALDILQTTAYQMHKCMKVRTDPIAPIAPTENGQHVMHITSTQDARDLPDSSIADA